MNTNGHEGKGDVAVDLGFSTTHCFVNRFHFGKSSNTPVFIRVNSCPFVVKLNRRQTFTRRLITVYRTQSRFRATRLVVFHNLSEFSEAQGHGTVAKRLLCFHTTNDCYEILN
jgi:hypothetical protein